ncbi:STAS domain-containing protein [Inhella gelatinilytica]|uniref:STAS domain-containing protein n=1 Tax=Inhella gelatinilytica TaxID=2795030 RepID=A0A931IV74_9BURK|nr:STAS domain-containing protein [Inhella gelatinilytica]MBH9552161.1 STAS domain-containing protein [Inhella gelatinilytica]
MGEPLQLGTEWTIAQASQLHQRLLESLFQSAETAEAPSLDLGSVDSMDSAGVQLLIALRRSLQERGQELLITAASPTVRAALQVYRVRDLLLPPEVD